MRTLKCRPSPSLRLIRTSSLYHGTLNGCTAAHSLQKILKNRFSQSSLLQWQQIQCREQPPVLWPPCLPANNLRESRYAWGAYGSSCDIPNKPSEIWPNCMNVTCEWLSTSCAHRGWQTFALSSSWSRELRMQLPEHSISPMPGECKALEQCCPVSPAHHTCLLFSFCLTHMFLASSLLWQSLGFRSWVSQGQERLNCTEPQPEEYSRMNCGTWYEAWPFTGQECTWVVQFKKVQVIHTGGDNS